MVMNNDGAAQQKLGLLIIAISLAAFMAALDGTIVNIALPDISEYFGASTSSISWVSTAYLLVMTSCVLIFGKISDIIGYRKIFLSGFIVFTVGSFCCGYLPELFDSFGMLIAARILQGIGGAMICGITFAMVSTFFPKEKKAKAMGITVTFASLGTAIGPTVGGFLTEYLSWNWIFYINVPVGICAILLGGYVVPSSPARTGGKFSFDYKGGILMFVGMSTLIYAMTTGSSAGWTSLPIIGSFLICVLAFGYFIINECRVSDPLLDISLFKSRNFLFANISLAILFFIFGGMNFLMPFYLQYVQGYSVAASGLILTALSLAMMISGLLSGMLYNKTGSRKLCITSAILMVLGYFLLTRISELSTLLYIVLTLFIIGFALGFFMTPNNNLVLNMSPKSQQGMISSLLTLERNGPMTIGIAFFQLICVQAMLDLAKNNNVITDTPIDIKLHLLSAGFDLTFLVALIFAVVILILTLITREEIHPDHQNDDELASESVLI